MKHFVPHALIFVALAALIAGSLPEKACLVMLLGAHLLVPAWAAVMAKREPRVRAIMLGPGAVVGVHAIGLLVVLLSVIGGGPEDTWIMLMIAMFWALALAAYILYCAIVFAIVTRVT